MNKNESDTDSSDVECLTCGRGDFASEQGMKSHHTQAHGESIAGVTIACAWCDREKRVEPNQVARSERHFCDQQCQGKWQSEHRTGEMASNWNGGDVVVECVYCGVDKEVKPHVAIENDRHFCDFECFGKWRSEHRTGEKAPNWNGGDIVVECVNCGVEMEVTPHRAAESERHFCDHVCYGRWQSEHLTGENNPAWNGGPAFYGKGWNAEKRSTVRDQAGRECTGCGIHEDELPRRLDVHHIVKARSFDDPKKANAVENLVALCRECHMQWEQMSPLRPIV